jgi:hypothetical protein
VKYITERLTDIKSVFGWVAVRRIGCDVSAAYILPSFHHKNSGTQEVNPLIVMVAIWLPVILSFKQFEHRKGQFELLYPG